MKFHYSIPGTYVHGTTTTIGDAEEAIGASQFPIIALSCDGNTQYFYRTREEMENDKDCKYTPQISGLQGYLEPDDDEEDEDDEF